nr:hypothetical protein [Tanacetum cinerariifolium]
MDSLAENHAVIVSDEKTIRIPHGDEFLIIQCNKNKNNGDNNASHNGLGTIMRQKERMVSYASRQQKVHEKKWKIHDLELRAVGYFFYITNPSLPPPFFTFPGASPLLRLDSGQPTTTTAATHHHHKHHPATIIIIHIPHSTQHYRRTSTTIATTTTGISQPSRHHHFRHHTTRSTIFTIIPSSLHASLSPPSPSPPLPQPPAAIRPP